jgi:hypothetical protein
VKQQQGEEAVPLVLKQQMHHATTKNARTQRVTGTQKPLLKHWEERRADDGAI